MGHRTFLCGHPNTVYTECYANCLLCEFELNVWDFFQGIERYPGAGLLLLTGKYWADP